MHSQIDWMIYINQMEKILMLKLDDIQRAELLIQFNYIASIVEPLMSMKLDERIEVAGVFHP
ncbi:oxalurate catabolism protein HpxX [Pantoea sp. Aalb]|uniref:oxalurate catabolism protein HpxX n=1 Tax=Pantoea sp. Aalb TaxID=2576762 RepID=UPI001320D4DA|nr:oxalurate catabolism protein HpxX [Pantoea sp. Aalb]MXP67602.1 oxalurate catabolism protein HpxX [Pantoea sp. Aalb]